MEDTDALSVGEVAANLDSLIEGLDARGEPIHIVTAGGTHGVLLSETMFEALIARIRNLEGSLSITQAREDDEPRSSVAMSGEGPG